jgi:hypothetical protein
MSIIKVIPIPNNTFTSNSITISNPIKDNIYDYDHTGDYKIKCSSYINNYPPYNAFNKLNNTYWQSGNANSTFYSNNCKVIISYSATPYKDVFPNGGTENSSYQGGNRSKWVTKVGKVDQNEIYGEWIQIQIPKADKLYLHDYSILTPVPKPNNSTFPTKFMVVGSENETTWEYIDLQNIKNPPDTTFQRPIVFNVNSSKSYSYYRLIIMEMPLNNSVVRINQWALNFLPYLSINKEAFTNYTNYNTSIPLEIENIHSSVVEPEYINNTNYNGILPIFCTSILAISILFYYKKLLK